MSDFCGGTQIVNHSEPVEFLAKLLAVGSIPFYPNAEVFFRREQISLRRIAFLVCKNKVMPQIQRIKRPRYEMINVGLPHRLPTIKAKILLEFTQRTLKTQQSGPFCSEEELMKICGFSNNGEILLTNPLRPTRLNQFRDQSMKPPEAKGHSWIKSDRSGRDPVWRVIQKRDTFSPNIL